MVGTPLAVRRIVKAGGVFSGFYRRQPGKWSLPGTRGGSMRARTAIAWTSHRVRLTVAGWGLTTVLACVALSACTSSSSPPVTVLSPTVSGSGSSSATGAASGGASAGASGSASPHTGSSTSAPASGSASSPASGSASSPASGSASSPASGASSVPASGASSGAASGQSPDN